MLKKVGFIVFSLIISIIALRASALAQDPFQEVCQRSNQQSSVCKSQNTTKNPLIGPDGIITQVTQVIIVITGAASVIMIMVGGFKYIVSTGDTNQVNSAKNTILYAVVGLVVAVLGQTIVSLVLQRL